MPRVQRRRFPQKRLLTLILLAFVALATVYSVIVPPFETPDEIWHFAFIQYVAAGHGLPVSAPKTQALWQQQGVQAPGYYLLGAAATAWIDQSDFPQIYARRNPHSAIGRPDAAANHNFFIHHQDENWPWQRSILALHLARLLSVVLGALTLWASYKTLALIVDERSALMGVAAVAFIPQFLFISAAASNDNAVNALAALVLWRLAALIVGTPALMRSAKERLPSSSAPGNDLGEDFGGSRLSWRELLPVGCLLGLALLSKLSALGLVGLTGLTVLWLAWQRRSWRVIGQSILWIGLPMLAIAGWWYIRNWQLYGDPLAWNIWQANILLRVEPASWQTVAAELGSLERSFWGLFGWLNVPYPEPIYLFFRAIEMIVTAGWLAATVHWVVRKRRLSPNLWAGLLLILWLAILTVSWLRFMRIAPAAQGRYFFPAAPPLALLIALGLGAWRLEIVRIMTVAGLFVLSVATPLWIIRPAYTAPPTHAELAATLTPLPANLGGNFAILGVDAQPEALTPGATAIVTVAWRALAPTATDYSVFIHLVDDEGLIVAQRDTMPGGGLRPTSQWQPGEVRVERYRVPIPATAYTPDHGRWAVGLYSSQTGARLPVTLTLSGTASPAFAAQVQDNALQFGQATIATPAGSAPNPIQVGWHDNMTLAGYTVNRRRLHAGDDLEVTLYWQARGPVSGAYAAFVHLLDAHYHMVGGDDAQLLPPTNRWDATTRLAPDTYRLHVAANAQPGIYQLEVGLYDKDSLDRLTLVEAQGAEGADHLLLGPLEIMP